MAPDKRKKLHPERPARITIPVRIHEDLLRRMVELHTCPSDLLRGTLEREIKRREERFARKKEKQFL